MPHFEIVFGVSFLIKSFGGLIYQLDRVGLLPVAEIWICKVVWRYLSNWVVLRLAYYSLHQPHHQSFFPHFLYYNPNTRFLLFFSSSRFLLFFLLFVFFVFFSFCRPLFSSPPPSPFLLHWPYHWPQCPKHCLKHIKSNCTIKNQQNFLKVQRPATSMVAHTGYWLPGYDSLPLRLLLHHLTLPQNMPSLKTNWFLLHE
jgi:hypothetical protein